MNDDRPTSWTDRLTALWLRLNEITANPMCAIGALCFCLGWFAVSFLTNGGSLIDHGRFDPGMSVGGFIENAIQLVLLFVGATASLSALSHAQGAHREARGAHEHAREANRRADAALAATPCTPPAEEQ